MTATVRYSQPRILDSSLRCLFVAPREVVAQDTGAKMGRAIDDTVITGKAALIPDAVTKAHQINGETRPGDVLLSGFVDTK